MMIYNNPNDYWQGQDPYKGLNDDERRKVGCMQAASFIVGVILALLLCALLNSCSTTKYMPVTETRTEHHWHTDSVKERDSTHTERNTIIRELDSAAMARYGIQMESNQRAWLVLQREMENRLRELEHMTAQRDTLHDSIPVPYPVEKKVKAELTWWQESRLVLANIVLVVIGFLFLYHAFKVLKLKP